MFEKEAEEYAMKKICKNCTYKCYTENILKSNKLDCFSYARAYKIFKDGAEFGYNKANEWHYVKDGDLPTDKTEKKYLIALKSEYGGFFYETDIWCETLNCFASNNSTKIYAWKKIVLPKEMKGNEKE